ncbi:MAG: hypothetical protein DRQ44_13320 [Gammaproteobacteria bacterium]|nr:MAG: hypothetical protein DRQ44_13320 [Gammaproteobacteria bacterium]
MKNTMKKSLSVAAGLTFAATLSASPIANADTNPFGMQNLESGYMQLAEGKCGEGKCGGKEVKEAKCGEGKCGEGMSKASEAKCGEGKCGEGMMESKAKEAKCGEGKCGGGK